MKRKDIIQKFREAGFTFEEGGSHTKAFDPQGRFRAPIGRHAEISEFVVRQSRNRPASS